MSTTNIRDIQKILFSAEEIQKRVSELGKQISLKYQKSDKEIILVGLLKGSFIFLADLARQISIKNKVDFITVSSYGNSTTTSGNIKLKKDMDIDPSDKHIIIVEDLIDSGTTLQWIKKHIESKKPLSVELCCMLQKDRDREIEMKIDYIGYICPDEFVVGYGMDFAENYRTLPFVGVLKKECYNT